MWLIVDIRFRLWTQSSRCVYVCVFYVLHDKYIARICLYHQLFCSNNTFNVDKTHFYSHVLISILFNKTHLLPIVCIVSRYQILIPLKCKLNPFEFQCCLKNMKSDRSYTIIKIWSIIKSKSYFWKILIMTGSQVCVWFARPFHA